MNRQVITEETVPRNDEARLEKNIGLTKAQRVVYTIFAILTGLLLLRFVFVLLGANPANAIADIVYTLSGPFVEPFQGLFSVENELGTARFEIETLVAILIYGLLAWAIIRIVGIGKDTTDRAA